MKLAWFALALVLTIGLYRPVLSAPFVYEDSNWTAAIASVDSHAAWSWDVPSRDLTMRTYVWQYQQGGLNPSSFHAVNVLLHLIIGLLVAALAHRITGDLHAGIFAGIVFLWHPLNSQAVSYVSARTDLLMTLFLLLSTLAVIGRSKIEWALLPVTIGAALLSKESAIVLVVLLPWAWYCVKGGSRYLIGGSIGAVLVAILFADRFWFALNVEQPAAMLDHFGIQAAGFWRLVGLFLVPVGLSIDPDPWALPVFLRLLAITGVITLGILCLAMRKRSPVIAFGLGWALLSVCHRFLAVSAGEPLHEHQFFNSMVGLSVIAGALLASMTSSSGDLSHA